MERDKREERELTMVVDLAKFVALHTNGFREVAEQPFLEAWNSHRGAGLKDENSILPLTTG